MALLIPKRDGRLNPAAEVVGRGGAASLGHDERDEAVVTQNRPGVLGLAASAGCAGFLLRRRASCGAALGAGRLPPRPGLEDEPRGVGLGASAEPGEGDGYISI